MGFPCNPVGFFACRAPSLKDLEPPRKASNLSPEPIPSEPVRVVLPGNRGVSAGSAQTQEGVARYVGHSFKQVQVRTDASDRWDYRSGTGATSVVGRSRGAAGRV
jgi:hypothetical protein